ncbi:MAG TPA: DUF4339 domain-containing protein [Clostridia bacterium]|nr:DUF4339 domain-containing protein [Clostridia bacterium]
MEITYMVRGADGKQYGPVSLEQLDNWIREGRLPTQAQVRRSDMEYWAAAADFQELQPLFGANSSANNAAAPAVQGGALAAQRDPATAAQMKSGASWFYWIAGLSLINSVVAFTGSSWRFMLGLGITQIFDGFAANIGTGGKAVALGLDVLVTGVFILFGIFAYKGHTWAFITGMVLFTLDGLLILLFKDWLGVAFHAFVLFCLFRGMVACRQLNTHN